MEGFGKWMKQTRKNWFMTAQDLGDKIGVSASYILQIENGQRDCPQKRLYQIGEAFGMSNDEIEYIHKADSYNRTYMISNTATVEYDAGFKNMTVTIQGKPPMLIRLTEKQMAELRDYFDEFGW